MTEDFTVESAPESVRRNLELWAEIWRERCNQFKELGEGTYSKHILSVLPDLIEEVEQNEEAFSRNPYAKSFYAANLSRYLARGSKESMRASPAFSKHFAQEVQTEIGFILEALTGRESGSGAFRVFHLLPCMHRIDLQLQSSESCSRAVGFLVDLLCKAETISGDSPDLIELCDTLISLFWRKGTLPESIESLAGRILAGINRYGENEIYSSYPGAPAREGKSKEDFENLLKAYFAKLSIRERFSQIKILYDRTPKSYEIIFRVDGFEGGTSSFRIGEVVVYDPAKEPHIKSTSIPSSKPDFAGIENVATSQMCVAVKASGTDVGSMKFHARRKAERALGLISIRRHGEKPITLSTAYSVVTDDGEEVAGGTERYKLGVLHTSDLAHWSKDEYERFGSWLYNTSVNETIKRWLASMDWHRKAVECEQSSEMLLNAWFSIEHLFKGKEKVSLRLPAFLHTRPDQKNSSGPWYPVDEVANAQLIVSLAKIKHELRDYAGNVLHDFLPGSRQFLRLKYGRDFALSDDVLSKFLTYGGKGYHPGRFVDVSDAVIEQTQAGGLDGVTARIQLMRRLFYDEQYALVTLKREIWRIKDDIYNVYRIRNMLVHRSATDSAMLDYYATRALDYSHSVLTDLKLNLLQTKEDSEISTLDEYFQKWVLDGNIGLEAVQKGNMSKFREWAFS